MTFEKYLHRPPKGRAPLEIRSNDSTFKIDSAGFCGLDHRSSGRFSVVSDSVIPFPQKASQSRFYEHTFADQTCQQNWHAKVHFISHLCFGRTDRAEEVVVAERMEKTFNHAVLKEDGRVEACDFSSV